MCVVVRCVLCSFLFVVCCLSLLLFVVRRSLFDDCLLFVVCCLVFGVRCLFLLFGVCWLW